MNLPEFNVTGIDYQDRAHLLRSRGPVIDIHSHVTMTHPEEKPAGPAGGAGAQGSSEAAERMLKIATEFEIVHTVSMAPPQDMAPLQAKLGQRISFNGMLNKKPEDSDDVAYQLLDSFLSQGVRILKLWSAPRGRERGLFVNAPWRIECLKRARAAGVRIVMVHVGDPDAWWQHTYTDLEKFGSKASQYEPFEEMLSLFPDMTWIGAHMGGDPEHPDHLQALIEKYPHLVFDTSATKWQVREMSRQRTALRQLLLKYPDRFCFGSDLVTRHTLPDEHYVSRYWSLFTLLESTWEGTSPIADPDYIPAPGEPTQPRLLGFGLPEEVLRQIYYGNANRILNGSSASSTAKQARG